MANTIQDGSEGELSQDAAAPKITLRGAIFIGIGSMVGAGIFALFGRVAGGGSHVADPSDLQPAPRFGTLVGIPSRLCP